MATVREVLTADRTYYVRTDGDDSNSGLVNDAANAFLTIQKACNVVGTLDLAGYHVTIQVANGIYTAGGVISIPWIGGDVTIQGDISTPSNVLINSPGSCFSSSIVIPNYLTIQGFELRVSSSGHSVANVGSGTLRIANLIFGTSTNYHIYAGSPGAYIFVVGDYQITGGASVHMLVNTGGHIVCPSVRSVTLIGNPAFSAFAYATRTGVIQVTSSFTGSATGKKYSVDTHGVVYASGIVLPGSTNGTIATGGQYVGL